MSDSTASPPGAVPTLARKSCFACRAKKRKCNRELPACDLCRRNHRPCEYAEYPASPAESSALHADEPVNSARRAPSRNEAMSLFFLDSYMYKQRKGAIAMWHGLPKEFLALAQDEAQVHLIVESYFKDFHPYFANISKRRFLSAVVKVPVGDQPDLVFLLATIQMLVSGWNTAFSPGGSEDLYYLSKSFYSFLEMRGVVSLKVVQGLILIAIYELGNAIYPAAYMTIGSCCRLAQALGIHERRSIPRLLPQTWLWTEVEECRRTWWACLVLERYVNIGLEGRSFACPDAKPDDLLPMDEQRWESGYRHAWQSTRAPPSPHPHSRAPVRPHTSSPVSSNT